MTARRRALLVVIVALATVAVGSSVAAIAARPDDGTGRIVLVSGKDDHGLVTSARVALLAAPNAADAVGAAGDGTLVEVVGTHGEWLEVRTVEGRAAQGWVNDFYLRGVVHLVGPPPSCHVTVGGRRHPAGGQATVEAVQADRVLVRATTGRHQGWVDRSVVRELAPTGADGCTLVAAAGGH
ncbi:MAG: hypothetical protein ACRDWY_09980 [Actinomycetes bacterium]